MSIIKDLGYGWTINYVDECVELQRNGREIARIQDGGTFIGPSESDVEHVEALIAAWKERQ